MLSECFKGRESAIAKCNVDAATDNGVIHALGNYKLYLGIYLLALLAKSSSTVRPSNPGTFSNIKSRRHS